MLARAVEAHSVWRFQIRVLSLAAIGMGALLTALPAPKTASFQLLDQIAGWPHIAGSVLAALGAAQLWAAMSGRPGVVRWVAFALAAWFLVLTVVFAAQWVLWLTDAQGARPVVYQTAIYAALTALELRQVTAARRLTRLGLGYPW